MYKVYLNNFAIWFETKTAAEAFINENAGAGYLEFNQYWNGKTGQWEDKQLMRCKP